MKKIGKKRKVGKKKRKVGKKNPMNGKFNKDDKNGKKEKEEIIDFNN